MERCFLNKRINILLKYKLVLFEFYLLRKKGNKTNIFEQLQYTFAKWSLQNVNKQPLLLRLKGGGKGQKRVGDLTPEELIQRRATEKFNKQKQRARARNLTLEQYQQNIGKKQPPIILERAQPAVQKTVEKAVEKLKETQKRKKGKIVEKENKKTDQNIFQGFRDIFSDAGLERTSRRRNQAKNTRWNKRAEKSAEKWQTEAITEENRQQAFVQAELVRTAHDGVFNDYKIPNYTTTLMPRELLDVMRPEIERIIRLNIPAKIVVKFHVRFQKTGEDGEKILEIKYVSSDAFGINNRLSDLTVEWAQIEQTLTDKLAVFVLEKSGWSIDKIFGIHIQTSRTALQQGHSYVEIPKWLSDKHAVINIRNEDHKCFIYAVDRSLNPKESHPERVDKTLKKCESNYNLTGITFPVDTKQFQIFEQNNPDISLIVYYLDHDVAFNRIIQPLYPSIRECEKEAVLLLYKDHFMTVTSESRLLALLERGDEHAKPYPCRRCANFFRTEEALKQHKNMCKQHTVARTIFPKLGANILKFSHPGRILRAPLVIYADAESVMKVLGCKMRGTVTQLCKHKPSGFGFVCVYSDGHHEYHQLLGKYSAKEFVNKLYSITRAYYEKTIKDIPLTGEELDKSNTAMKTVTNCKICGERLVRDPNNEIYSIHRPVKFCDGYTGEFLGIAHHDCEEMAKHTKKIPVLFHNLSGYDLKLFIRELGSDPEENGGINVISRTEEDIILLQKKVCVDNVEGYVRVKDPNEKGKFIFTKKFKDVNYILSFQDSLKHLASSLESLAKSLRPDQFKITRANVDGGEERFKLISKKGVYPYNYMDSFKKLKETKLPPKESFYNILKETPVLDADYEHAQNVWKEFGCKTMWEYHNLYLKTDVCILADVFEAYRDLSMDTFELDPVHYATAPSFFWDALLKVSGVRIELISEENSEMYDFFERGIRGGISMAAQRYFKANNKYMHNYDPTKESTFIVNPDKNALYASAESEPLPIGGFKWMTEDEFTSWENVGEAQGELPEGFLEYLWLLLENGSGRWGCTLEVDLKYPKHLHDLHNDIPLAPEAMTPGNQQKLIPNLNDKKNYIIYHETLKTYLKYGMVLTKIHRGVKYVEFAWMKTFVDINAQLREEASLVFDVFKTNYYKLGPNSVFGKTMENVRNRMSTDVTQSPEEALYMASKPTFRGRLILNENMSLLQRGRTSVKLNKPIFMGQAILDRSKSVMYDFHYGYLYKKWGAKNVSLNYIDTDGEICTIKTEDFYADIKDDDEWDTSNFPGLHNLANPKHKPFDIIPHPSGITPRNRKVPGKVKLEAGARIILKVVCICSKMYSVITQKEEGDIGNNTICKCKGADRHKVDGFSFETFERCLFENEVTTIETNRIKSRKWNLYTEKSSKVALRNTDDKRIIVNDGFTTYARGSWRILKKGKTLLPECYLLPKQGTLYALALNASE